MTALFLGLQLLLAPYAFAGGAVAVAVSGPAAPEDAPEIEVPESGDEASPPESAPAPKREWLSYRGYAVAEFGWIPSPKFPSLSTTSGVGEANLAFTAKTGEKLAFFGDFLGDVYVPDAQDVALIAQAGARYQATEAWSFALGKERNFRAPGLVVNPSDFIHPAQNVPGQRLQRSGVWLARGSYQTRELMVDSLFLPALDQTRGGAPNGWRAGGGAARAFWNVSGFDVGLTAGYVNEAWQGGASVSGYALRKLETHAELGVREGSAAQALAGTRLDIGSSSGLTLEAYWNGRGLSRLPPRQAPSAGAAGALSASALSGLQIFPRRWYSIASYSTSEWLNRLDVTASLITSLDDGSTLGFLRTDWLLSSSQTLGLLAIGLGGPPEGQFGARPTDTRLGLEWKVSF